MTNNFHRWLNPRSLLAPLALVLCWQYPVMAQTTTEQGATEAGPQWYQVELLIFERRLADQGGPDAEAWPKNIALAYPPNIRHLHDPNEAGAESGEQAPDSLDAGTTGQEQPFTLLGHDQFELSGTERGVERDPNLRVLFHEAWRQPMVPVEQSPAIIISGGEKYDEHRELEGTVTFSVSRYLHVRTNLWLTQFEANYGQAIGQWPPLPRQPRKADGSTEDELAVDLNANDTQPVFNSWGTSGNNAYGTNTNTNTYGTGGGEFNFNQKNDALQLNNYGYLSQQPFVTKNIVLVQQQRRMRSDELHYIDHPRLGILVQIHSYDPLKETDADAPR